MALIFSSIARKTSRILKSINRLEDNSELILTCKWGCDGSSGQQRYKQILHIEPNIINEDTVFISSFVPLRLSKKSSSDVLWKNPRPSSPWFCRPIKFHFIKESTEVIEEEINRIKYEIEHLNTTKINNVQIEYSMILTMVDNKVCNSITHTTSAMRCYICNAKPTEMNDLEIVHSKTCNSDNFSFGISSLHAWIRCFQCLLHISYNMPFKKWTASTPELKKIQCERKQHIQKQFKDKLGLLVDFVKQGWGSSNDGNTARRFFKNDEISAEITDIDRTLIKRFHIILQVISSPYKIDANKFQKYTLDTAKHFIKNYGWYYMPASVHKLLIHGADIIQRALLPIGQLSEEAQETRHKDFKKYRTKDSRKISRTATNEDTFYRLLLTSDPYMSTIRLKSFNKNHEILDPEAKELINE